VLDFVIRVVTFVPPQVWIGLAIFWMSAYLLGVAVGWVGMTLVSVIVRGTLIFRRTFTH